MTEIAQTESVEVTETKVEVDAPQVSLIDLLKKAGGPSEADIENLKQQYGDVFVSAFSDEEVYVWRSLMRDEFRILQLRLQDPDDDIDQLTYEEEVCRTCVLWPDAATLNSGLARKGGTASTLAEQVAQQSNFFNPQQAALLVAKL